MLTHDHKPRWWLLVTGGMVGIAVIEAGRLMQLTPLIHQLLAMGIVTLTLVWSMLWVLATVSALNRREDETKQGK